MPLLPVSFVFSFLKKKNKKKSTNQAANHDHLDRKTQTTSASLQCFYYKALPVTTTSVSFSMPRLCNKASTFPKCISLCKKEKKKKKRKRKKERKKEREKEREREHRARRQKSTATEQSEKPSFLNSSFLSSFFFLCFLSFFFF